MQKQNKHYGQQIVRYHNKLVIHHCDETVLFIKYIEDAVIVHHSYKVAEAKS